MITDGLIQKASLLLQQGRYSEAENILGQLLTQNPNDINTLTLLSEVNFQQKKYDKAEELINNAIALSPDESSLFYLKSRIYLYKDEYNQAEKYANTAISLLPEDENNYVILSNILLAQKKYKEALEAADRALSLAPDNVFALNMRSTALLKLNNKEESFRTIEEALHESPNNPHTHANYGWGLLEKGDKKKALEHFSEALKNDPDNNFAQAGMIEALKARFVFYRLFLKYSFWMSNLTSKYQWGVILGFYFGTKFLQRVAANNEALRPFLIPIIVLLALFAFSTWIIGPVSNLFLRLNYYGKHLLSREEKMSSSLVGIFLGTSILSVIGYFISKDQAFLILAIFTFTMMIPVGKIFNQPKNIFIGYNIVMFLLGGYVVFQTFAHHVVPDNIAIVYFFGFLAFQFLGNYFTINRKK
ncbi:tetratricopeptide repeat protein [Flavobacterium sp.]|uniref:tetratricopeptide repeat protein n=1 Tax=Flavobacterium sp. TaxID=239 RepID=UPI003A9239F8